MVCCVRLSCLHDSIQSSHRRAEKRGRGCICMRLPFRHQYCYYQYHSRLEMPYVCRKDCLPFNFLTNSTDLNGGCQKYRLKRPSRSVSDGFSTNSCDRYTQQQQCQHRSSWKLGAHRDSYRKQHKISNHSQTSIRPQLSLH